MKKMEKLNDGLFQNLTGNEARMVAGGDSDATADGEFTTEVTWSEDRGADAKVDYKIRF